MKASREQIMSDVLSLLRKLADDWEYTGEITPQTRFFADMGLGSLDVVVLGTAVQEHYNISVQGPCNLSLTPQP